MPAHSFILNGKRVHVKCEDDVRLLWVIRDILGVTGPKYGCGINVCKACTCHINGSAFNPCSVPVSKIKRSDEITTIEGLPATVGKDLHPMQEAWLDRDVPQCGYCQPGQIMAAVSMVNDVRRTKGRRQITNHDIETLRNMCRCGTYPRIREAIREGARHMPNPAPKKKRHTSHKKAAAKRTNRAADVPVATTTPTAAPSAVPSATATATATATPVIPVIQVPGITG